MLQPEFLQLETHRETVYGSALITRLAQLAEVKATVEFISVGKDGNSSWIIQFRAPAEKRVWLREPVGTGFRYDPVLGW